MPGHAARLTGSLVKQSGRGVLRPFLSAAFALCFAAWNAAAAPLAGNTALDSLHQRIQSGEIPDIHSVIVIRHGETLAEWYFSGSDEVRGAPAGTITFGPETPHDLRSVSKSIVSLLFGIAMTDGKIASLDTPVLDYFPEYKDLQSPERRKIRLRDLLSMTSGLHWDEHSFSYIDPRNSETAMDNAPDRYRYILSQPIDAPPGTQWRYSGGDVALIAAVIARTTKMPLEQYAQQKLFAPLGIETFTWLKDEKGIPIAASGLRLMPRDMAKIGLLVLHHGRADNGVQIVPESWIAEATAPHATVDTDDVCPTQYGYFWWLGPACAPPWIGAIGNGGQRIWIVPARDLVIVITAGLYNKKQSSIAGLVNGIVAAVAQQ